MNNEQSTSSDFMSIVVRLMGLAILVVGLFVGIKVIFEAWDLYEQPERIERFADAIEKGSNLDSLLASLSPKLAPAPAPAPKPVDQLDGDEAETEVTTVTPAPQQAPEPLRVTYFLAWFIAIFLLMIIGSLATRAIKTGGELALYDLQVKRFANLLMKEVRNESKRDS